jgi:hypothetical protein
VFRAGVQNPLLNIRKRFIRAFWIEAISKRKFVSRPFLNQQQAVVTELVHFGDVTFFRKTDVHATTGLPLPVNRTTHWNPALLDLAWNRQYEVVARLSS